MTTPVNCWEFKKCGREEGGENEEEFGICPAATETRLNGVNNGRNGGRSCWVLAGTLCDSRVQGSAVDKLEFCRGCTFFKQVSKFKEVTINLAELLAKIE